MSEQYPAITAALLSAKSNMPVLGKGETNAHGGYSYASIDAFYAGIAPIVTAAGLSWHTCEVGSEIVELMGNKGPTNAVRTTYETGVYHSGGEHWPAFFRATITHPLQGAQTAGSSLSYFEKLFMRTTFSIVTGEKDADDTDSSIFDTGPAKPKKGAKTYEPTDDIFSLEATPDKLPIPQALLDIPAVQIPMVGGGDPTPAQFDTPAEFIALAEAFIPLAATEAQLTKYWNDNEATFNSLKTEAPEAYASLIAAFKARKNQLKKG